VTTNTNFIEIEIEIKIKVADIEAVKKQVLEKGFRIVSFYSFEHNLVFDTGDRGLAKNHLLLRLRKLGNQNFLTFKRPLPGTGEPPAYKIREEIETEVSDFDRTKTIFTALGYEVVFIYEKFREIYDNGRLKIMIDHTPIGDFIEIEGLPGDIDKMAVQLGYGKSDYITDNYLALYRKEHKTGHMQFKPSTSSTTVGGEQGP
jgi:adenylate cyclase class 2